MIFTEQQLSNSILTSINFLKNGSNKEHNYLTSHLNELLPIFTELKANGYKFQHVVKADVNVVSNWQFEMDDLEEVERFIDNYTMNEICNGRRKDYDLPENFDTDLLEEELLIIRN